MLIFSADVHDPAACSCPSGESIDAIKAALEGAAKIVDQGLAEVESVGKRRAGDLRSASVDGFEMGRVVVSTTKKRHIR